MFTCSRKLNLPLHHIPNLLPHDTLWLKLDLPPGQLNHLVLIVAFLRGKADMPCDNWLTMGSKPRTRNYRGSNRHGSGYSSAVAPVRCALNRRQSRHDSLHRKRQARNLQSRSCDFEQCILRAAAMEQYPDWMKSLPQGDPSAVHGYSAKLGASYRSDV